MKKTLFLALLVLSLSLASVCAYAADETPTLALRDSIPFAEEALTKTGISPDAYWLYSITYTRSEKGYYWYYTFRPLPSSSGRQIYVKVYMDKTAEVSGI
jgi:hypothetical protein